MKRHQNAFNMVGRYNSNLCQTANFQYIITIMSGREVSRPYHNIIFIRGFSP